MLSMKERLDQLRLQNKQLSQRVRRLEKNSVRLKRSVAALQNEKKKLRGVWLTTLTDTETSEQKEICESVFLSKFFIFCSSDTNEYNFLQERDKLLQRNVHEMISIPFKNVYFWAQKFVPLLLCSFGYIQFYLARYSNHEGDIMFSSSLTPTGVVTKSYRYHKCDPNIRKTYYWFLEELTDERIPRVPEVPLYSLNKFNLRKLCATFIFITLSNRENISLQTQRNLILTTDFTFMKFPSFKSEIECLKCNYRINLPPSIDFTFYITQLEKQHVIIFLTDTKVVFDVYDILEFEAESSSSG